MLIKGKQISVAVIGGSNSTEGNLVIDEKNFGRIVFQSFRRLVEQNYFSVPELKDLRNLSEVEFIK